MIASWSEVLAIRPFDLPDNVFDLMYADRCGPVEVCEHKAYLSNPDEDTPHPPHVDPPPVPTLPEPLPPGRGWISQPQQQPQPRVNGSLIFGVPTPLRARTPTKPYLPLRNSGRSLHFPFSLRGSTVSGRQRKRKSCAPFVPSGSSQLHMTESSIGVMVSFGRLMNDIFLAVSLPRFAFDDSQLGCADAAVTGAH